MQRMYCHWTCPESPVVTWAPVNGCAKVLLMSATGFLQVLWFLPTYQKHASRWTGYAMVWVFCRPSIQGSIPILLPVFLDSTVSQKWMKWYLLRKSSFGWLPFKLSKKFYLFWKRNPLFPSLEGISPKRQLKRISFKGINGTSPPRTVVYKHLDTLELDKDSQTECGLMHD